MSQQNQEQERILRDATSHGSYLWTNRDVENALLWFQPPSHSNGSGNDIAPLDDQQQQRDKGCEFLRRLLHAPGASICLPRQGNLQGTKKRKKSSTSDPQSTENYNAHDDHDCTRTKKVESPLRSVVLGYYQLFLASPKTKTETTNDSQPPTYHTEDQDPKAVGGDSDNFYDFTADDIYHAELASSRLLTDLMSIIAARKQTHDIYQAFLNVTPSRDDIGTNTTEIVSTIQNVMGKSQDIFSNITDEYMTHPATCTRAVYASTVFDMLLYLRQHPDNTNDISTVSIEPENCENNPELDRFIKNLCKMAPMNVQIQEVILLILLEPLRRIGCSRDQDFGNSVPQGFEPPIMPLCASLWTNLSSETIEKACTCFPIPMFVHFVLDTCPPSVQTSTFGSKESAQNVLDALSVSSSSQVRILWWVLPSPLLCTISQLYFSIACKYIQYWIEEAVLGHEKLYSDLHIIYKVGSEGINHTGIGKSGNKEEEPFSHAIRRIQEFSSTSDRLNVLCIQSLQIMENGTSSLAKSASFQGEDEDLAYRRSLACRAIHRVLEK